MHVFVIAANVWRQKKSRDDIFRNSATTLQLLQQQEAIKTSETSAQKAKLSQHGIFIQKMVCETHADPVKNIQHRQLRQKQLG